MSITVDEALDLIIDYLLNYSYYLYGCIFLLNKFTIFTIYVYTYIYLYILEL